MENNITKVYLLSVPLENDYKHTLYFSNEASQQSYFASKVKKSYTDFTYQRKDNVIYIPDHYDDIYNCNYVMYQNSKYNNKWFYAFIKDMKYENDECTIVEIETDVIQSWMFDYEIKPSFVEREHVDDDTIGKHINGENIQLGDYICNFHTKAGYDDGGLVIVVGTTKKPNGDKVHGTLYNNIYSGLKYYVFENSFDGATALEEWLQDFSGDGANEAIQCMFLAPKNIVPLREDHIIPGNNMVDKVFINHEGTEINMTRNHLDGYTPRNNKLLTYPYRYLMVSNNNGVSVPFEYEQFYEEDEEGNRTIIKPKFTIFGCLTPGCSVRMIPENYKGIEQNDEEGINLGKYPALNWTSDYFTNWLTQNGVNIGVSIFSDVVQTGIGILGAVLSPATGGVSALVGASAVAGGLSGISSTIGEVYKAAKTPPQSNGNVNCGDVITSMGQNDFHFYDMSIRKQFAEIIDQYFDMFGYKVNSVKIPNKAHRSGYWFTKTIDINIDGEIPQNDLQKIKDCYNTGITFWRTASEIQNYNIPNVIL